MYEICMNQFRSTFGIQRFITAGCRVKFILCYVSKFLLFLLPFCTVLCVVHVPNMTTPTEKQSRLEIVYL